MKYFLILLYIPLHYIDSSAQIAAITDTSDFVRISNAHIIFQQYGSGNLNSKTLSNVILYQRILAKPLKSKGFRDIVFFSISTRARMDTLFINNSCEKSNELIASAYNYTYIFGYNVINHTLYKLSGFKDNDFLELHNSLKDFREYELDERDYKKYKKFMKNFEVEGLALGCLFKSMNLNKKSCYSCCVPPISIFQTNSYKIIAP